MRESLRGAVCGFLVLALFGCSDSNDTVSVDSQLLETTIETTALPVFDALSLAASGATQPPPASEGLGGSGCEEGLCEGGGFLEICVFQGQGDAFELTLTYSACVIGGELFDGSVSTSSNAGQAMVVYDLRLGDAQIAGTVNVTSGKCDDVLIDSLFVGVGGIGATTTADLSYCGTEWPDGTMTQMTTSAAGTLIFDIVVQSNGLITIAVSDGEGNDIATCSGDLSTDTVTCQLVDQGQMVP